MKNPRTRRFFFRLGLLVLAGVLIRLIVSSQLIRSDPFVYDPNPETDQATYLQLSGQIAEHGTFPDVFYYQPFYYSVFLPAARLIFRSRDWSPALAQTICAGLIIWLAGLIAAILRGRTAGLFAGAFAAFASLLILYVPYALLEIQQCLWITLFVYLLLRAVQRKKAILWGAAGLILSFSVLSRGNSLCFLPPAALAFFFAFRKTGFRKALLPLTLFLLCLILPQLPFSIRNSLATGKLSGPSTAGPAVLALGNSPEAPACGLDNTETFDFWMNSQNERSVPGRIFDWAKKEPAAFLELQIRKFFYFWDSTDVPNNISIEINGGKSALFRSVPFLSSGILFFLFLTAFFLQMRRLPGKRKLLLLYLSVLCYAGAAAVFYILARFRVPAFGLLCAGAGTLAPILHSIVRKRDGHRILRAAVALTSAGIVVFLLCPVYAMSYEPAVMRLIRPDGVQMERGNGTLDIRDNGSIIAGAPWGIPLRSGLTVSKTFRLPADTAAVPSELLLGFLCETPESFSLSIDGAPPVAVRIRPREIRYPFPLPPRPPVSGEKTVELVFTGVRPGCTAVLLADPCRSYGRTRIDGKELDGEAVSRLRLVKEK